MACLKMMMGADVHNLGEGCSKDVGQGSVPKRPRGRPPKVGNFHDDVGPNHFTKVIMAPSSNLLSIPDAFRPYLGNVTRTIVLKTNTGCSRMVKLKDVNDMFAMDQGWVDLQSPISSRSATS